MVGRWRVCRTGRLAAFPVPGCLETMGADGTAPGDKPARRIRNATTPASAQDPAVQRLSRRSTHSANSHVTPVVRTNVRAQAARHSRAQDSASVQPGAAQTLQSAHTEATQVDAELASDLIASGATTQSLDTVIEVLSSHREGASINAAANASGINYRTAQRIVEVTLRRSSRISAGHVTGSIPGSSTKKGRSDAALLHLSVHCLAPSEARK